MTTFAKYVLEHVRTERQPIPTEQIIGDLEVFRRTMPSLLEEIPENVGAAVREAIAELVGYGRQKPGPEGWIFVAEVVREMQRELWA